MLPITETLYLTESNKVYDGKGQTITTDFKGDGLRIAPGVHDIVIKNYNIRNCNYGIRTYNSIHNDPRTLDNYNIEIKNCIIEENNLGIYLSRYTNNVEIHNCDVHHNGGTGIYCEHESNNNKIHNNIIMGNGYRWHREFPKWFHKFGLRKLPRFFWVQRAGLDINGSSDNHVYDNQFVTNAASGIQMFTNGWEFHKSKPEYSLPRYTNSDRNLIENNYFAFERVGVWIACRQYRDMTNWEYGTPQRERKWFWQVKKQPYPNWLALAAVYHWWTENQPFRSPFRLKMNLWDDFANDNTFKNNDFVDCQWDYIDNGYGNVIYGQGHIER